MNKTQTDIDPDPIRGGTIKMGSRVWKWFYTWPFHIVLLNVMLSFFSFNSSFHNLQYPPSAVPEYKTALLPLPALHRTIESSLTVMEMARKVPGRGEKK